MNLYIYNMILKLKESHTGFLKKAKACEISSRLSGVAAICVMCLLLLSPTAFAQRLTIITPSSVEMTNLDTPITFEPTTGAAELAIHGGNIVSHQNDADTEATVHVKATANNDAKITTNDNFFIDIKNSGSAPQGTAAGILAETSGDGSVEITSNANVTHTTKANGVGGAILGRITAASTGSKITIMHNGGTIKHTSDGTTEANSGAISAILTGGDSKGVDITLTDSKIETAVVYRSNQNDKAHGISVESTVDSGDVVVNVTNSTIEATGDNSDGIYVKSNKSSSTTNVAVTTNGGAISTDSGAEGYGNGIAIEQESSKINISGNSLVINNGTTITTRGTGFGSRALSISHTRGSTGEAKIVNTGSLTTEGANSAGIFIQQGNFAVNPASGASVIQNYGGIETKGAGSSGIHLRYGTGYTTIENSGHIMASYGAAAAGIYIDQTDGGGKTINNRGQIEALSDHAINIGGNLSDNEAKINNSGTITGYITTSTDADTLTNAAGGVINLRKFIADPTNGGARVRKEVAISNFGTGADTFYNNGVVRLLAVNGDTSTPNITGQYLAGGGALSIANSGIVQAQMVNLEEFYNVGLIDMTSNGLAGDLFGITQSGAVGAAGSGTYYSNGGALSLDTLINQGGAASLSDILVVDNVRISGGGATRIYVNPVAGSFGSLTEGDGIKLVEVLGHNTDPNGFVLGTPVIYGAYEYYLANGISAAGDQHWFLRNVLNGKPLLGTNGAAHLANQHLAGDMFVQNILDRRDTVREPDKNIWMRLNHRRSDGALFDSIDLDTTSTLLQLGLDLYKSEDEDFITGLYNGFASGRNEVKSKISGTKTSGEVKGYQLGIYGSWLPQDEVKKGLFADLWAHYAWFDNALYGVGMKHDRVDYSSRGYAVSAEIGYGLPLYDFSDSSKLVLEPHGQIIYQSMKTNNFIDVHDSSYTNGKAIGIRTRLGARLYAERPAGENGLKGLSPFIEANWLYNGVRPEVKLADTVTLKSDYGKNIAELKLGVQGQLSDKVDIWSHIGYQDGSNNYKQTEFQVGLSYKW
ncbi:MAG: autotransporter outer membrane beta-barrel domain-containing protein [Desulfobulbus oligotrophicus]|nr:autotransporter outer membrane beta-barrel domain-containing protein [Desulfobulbus oligotrophicus]